MFTFFSFQEASSLSLTLKPSCLYFFSKIIYKSINHSITEENFIADFKEAEFRPLYKNDRRADKPIYQPITILSNVSKIYERYLIINYMITLIKIFFQNTNVAVVYSLVLGVSF